MPKKLTFEEVAILAKDLDCPAKKVYDATRILCDALEEIPKTKKWEYLRQTLHDLTFLLDDANTLISRVQDELVIDRYRDLFENFNPYDFDHDKID